MNAAHPSIALLTSIFLISAGQASIFINEFLAGNDSITVPNAEPGRFDDWIELSNPTGTAIDLGGWRLTDRPDDPSAWIFPSGTTILPNGYFVVLASGDGVPDGNGNLHTNFKLSKSGDYVGLVRPDGTIASEFGPEGTPYPNQSDDLSYGQHPNTTEVVFFVTPTPGAANSEEGIARAAALEVSPQRGLYQTAQQVTLSTTTPGATIYFTNDGTPPLSSAGLPTSNATPYSGAITVARTTVIRSAATAPGLSPTPWQAHTYLILDIDNANPNGTDANGYNTQLLRQTRPAGYGNLSSGDYEMDTRVTGSTATSAGHGGLTVAQAMLQGIKEAPSLSISMPPADFIDIYANTTIQGRERACSAEFIPGENDSRAGFQEHCGLRAQGGASRNPSSSPKHSLSFRFRSEYGSGRLRQVLFPDIELANFNSIALRAGYNNSWIHRDQGQRQRGSMIRDQWMRESLRDMGNEDAGGGFLAHLFVNGLYWGLHNIAERQDNTHYANYHGGEEDLIDARNGSTFVEGNATAWNAMRATVSGRNWGDIQQVLDIDSYIDFQIIQRFGGNQDLKTDGNWRAAGGGPYTTPTEMRPWKLYSWDGERVLESPTNSSVPLDPMNIRNVLESIPEYRQRFADRAHFHLTGEGALTPAKTQARWQKYASSIDKAVIAESARWGDHRQSTPYDRDDWLVEQNRLYNSYFPVRTANVISQLENAGLFPDVEAPAFAINGQTSGGGFVGPENKLTLNGDAGIIYYTLDGSDPLLPDGSLHPGALSLASGVATETAFPFESNGWHYLNTGAAQSSSNRVVGNPAYDARDWKHPDFDDASWFTGQGLIGGRIKGAVGAASANTVIGIGPLGDGYPTVYFRKEFQVTAADQAIAVNLAIIRDDGIIVYLNGKEIYRENMPSGTVTYNDFAVGNADESLILEHTHPLAPGDFVEGTNILTIEVHNASAGSSDLGLDCTLSFSKPAGAAVLNLSESAAITARLKVGDDWSAPIGGTFLLEKPADATNLIISEINYHPREASTLDKIAASPLLIENRDQFEFIELLNISAEPLNLGEVSFSAGISLTLDLRALAPGERGLVVKDPEAFFTRYGSELAAAIVGTYSGSLDNDGEPLTLIESDGTLISSVTFNDAGSWPTRPDGDGSSLEIIDFTGNPNDPDNWAPSVSFHGSPGVNGLLQDQRLVINEVRSSDASGDFIEIHNTTASPIDIGGWLLTDSKKVYRSFRIPEVILGGLEYLTFNDNEYHPSIQNGIVDYRGASGRAPTAVTSSAHGLTTGTLITIDGYNGFSEFNDSFEVTIIDDDNFLIDAAFLDNAAIKGAWMRDRPFGVNGGGNGESLWLVEADQNGNPLNFVDQVNFGAAIPGTTLGRWLDGMGYNTLSWMTEPTPNAPNSGPVLGPVSISEVHYAPLGSRRHEFVELTNHGDELISLAFWKLRGGLDFDLTSDHALPPGQSLVIVTFDPTIDIALATNFRETFDLAESVTLIGPATDGPLNDERGTVRLQQGKGLTGNDQVTVDEVRYLASNPWPIATGGLSLTRNGALEFGNFPTSWNASLPSPGVVIGTEDYPTWASVNRVGTGELDPDGDLLTNLLEFALGTDPNSPNALPAFAIAGTNGIIVFPKHLARSGVSLEFQTSSDLEIWTTQNTTATGVNGSIQSNEFSLNLAGNPKIFWRLRALAF